MSDSTTVTPIPQKPCIEAITARLSQLSEQTSAIIDAIEALTREVKRTPRDAGQAYLLTLQARDNIESLSDLAASLNEMNLVEAQ